MSPIVMALSSPSKRPYTSWNPRPSLRFGNLNFEIIVNFKNRSSQTSLIYTVYLSMTYSDDRLILRELTDRFEVL